MLRSSRWATSSAEAASCSSSRSTSTQFGAEEALRDSAGEEGDEAEPDEDEHGGDDLAAGVGRLDVGAERRHRRHRPVDPVPGAEVLLVLLEGVEQRPASDRGHQRHQSRVVEPSEGEDFPCETGQAEQPQESQQSQNPQPLQPRGKDRRGEDDEEEVERVVPEPGAAVGDDGQHHYQLEQERQPGRPVEDVGGGLERPSRMGLADRDHRDRQQRRQRHRKFEPPLDARAALVHARGVGRRLPPIWLLSAHPRLVRRLSAAGLFEIVCYTNYLS